MTAKSRLDRALELAYPPDDDGERIDLCKQLMLRGQCYAIASLLLKLVDLDEGAAQASPTDLLHDRIPVAEGPARAGVAVRVPASLPGEDTCICGLAFSQHTESTGHGPVAPQPFETFATGDHVAFFDKDGSPRVAKIVRVDSSDIPYLIEFQRPSVETSESWMQAKDMVRFYGQALTAPVVVPHPCDSCKEERDTLKARVEEIEAKAPRVDCEPDQCHKYQTELIEERDTLKDRVATLEETAALLGQQLGISCNSAALAGARIQQLEGELSETQSLLLAATNQRDEARGQLADEKAAHEVTRSKLDEEAGSRDALVGSEQSWHETAVSMALELRKREAVVEAARALVDAPPRHAASFHYASLVEALSALDQPSEPEPTPSGERAIKVGSTWMIGAHMIRVTHANENSVSYSLTTDQFVSGGGTYTREHFRRLATHVSDPPSSSPEPVEGETTSPTGAPRRP